jgi:hypothetical protein
MQHQSRKLIIAQASKKQHAVQACMSSSASIKKPVTIFCALQLRPYAKSLSLHDHEGSFFRGLQGLKAFVNCSSLNYTASHNEPSLMEALEAVLDHAVQVLPKLKVVKLTFKVTSFRCAVQPCRLVSFCVSRAASGLLPAIMWSFLHQALQSGGQAASRPIALDHARVFAAYCWKLELFSWMCFPCEA